MGERSGAHASERAELSKRVSGASEGASGPLLTSRFQEVLNHCASAINVLYHEIRAGTFDRMAATKTSFKSLTNVAATSDDDD